LGQSRLPPHLTTFTGQLERRQPASGDSASEELITAPKTPQLTAVFSVHLDGINALSDEIQELVEWIHSLHPTVGFEVTGVYQSRSILIILNTPWYIWAQMNGLRGFALIGETLSQNKLPELLRPQQTVVGRKRKKNESP